MTEQERVDLIDVALRILDMQVEKYFINYILAINDLINKNENSTIKDILKLKGQ